jgi:predicted N-acetyltransferase YhbS
MKEDMITLRGEANGDHEAIRKLTLSAFAGSDLGHNGEADLVGQLHDNSVEQQSFVACINDEIIGHIMFTQVTIRAPQHELSGMGLAPMSVVPQHQKTGVGTKLLNHGIDQLDANGCPFIVVLGHPEYYARFGFLPASEFKISHGFAGIPQDVFFIRFNRNVTLSRISGGRVFYQPEFGQQYAEADRK